MTGSLVVDASFTLRALLPHQLQQKALGMLERWKDEGRCIYAPTLWDYETVSALNKLVHFKHLSPQEAEAAIRLAQTMPVQRQAPDAGQWSSALRWSRQLSRASAYDSFYLALAESSGNELWTADGQLFRAAAQPWVCLLTA